MCIGKKTCHEKNPTPPTPDTQLFMFLFEPCRVQIRLIIIRKYLCLRPGSNHGDQIFYNYLLTLDGIQMVFDVPEIIGIILC